MGLIVYVGLGWHRASRIQLDFISPPLASAVCIRRTHGVSVLVEYVLAGGREGRKEGEKERGVVLQDRGWKEGREGTKERKGKE